MGRPKYGGKPLKVGDKPAGSTVCCCNVNCCCSIFTVDPDALDEAGYFLDSPTELHWTISGDFSGSGTVPRTSVIGAGSACIRYQLTDLTTVSQNGCPGYDAVLTLDIKCVDIEPGVRGFTIVWNISTSDGGATAMGDPATAECEPFIITQSATVSYIIPSTCDGATSRTVTITITV